MATNRRTNWLTALTATLLLALPSSPAAAQTSCAQPTGPADPPAVTGGNDALSAAQPGPAPIGAPVRCWVGASGDAVLGARAIALADLILTFSDRNELVAFAPDGSEAWRVELGRPGRGLPGGLATDGTLVYAAAPVGLVALDPSDGSERWRVAVQQQDVAGATGAQSPAVVDERVFVVTNSAAGGDIVERTLVAAEAATGAELWRVVLDPTLPAGPISADPETVVVWDGRGTLFALEPEDGAERWRVPVEDLGVPPAGQVSLAGGLLVTALQGGEVVALSSRDGGRLWSYEPPSGMAVAVTLQSDTVYVNGVTELYAVDAAEGRQLWAAPIQAQTPPFQYQPVPAFVDDMVIIGSTDVNAEAALVAIDAADGSERWRTQVGIFGALLSPIVSGGRIYLPAFDIDQEGGLFAYGSAG